MYRGAEEIYIKIHNQLWFPILTFTVNSLVIYWINLLDICKYILMHSFQTGYEKAENYSALNLLC